MVCTMGSLRRAFMKLLDINKQLSLLQQGVQISHKGWSLVEGTTRTGFPCLCRHASNWPSLSQVNQLPTNDNALSQHPEGERHSGTSTEVSETGPQPVTVTDIERTIGLTNGEQRQLLSNQPKMPPDPHKLKVAVIGTPNAGKSTLVNQLLGWRIAAVSEKVHTTRRNALGVLTEGNTQLTFLDTPGLVRLSMVNRHKLERTLLVDPHKTLHKADIIIVLVDISNVWGRQKLPDDVLRLLYLHESKTTLLVLNKVDLLASKTMLLKTTRLLTEGTVGGKQHSQVAKPTRKELDVTKLLDHLEQEDQQEDEHLNQEMNQADSSNQEIPEKSCVPSSLTPSVLGHLGEQGAWHEYTKRLHQISQQIAQEERKGWPHFSRVFMVSAKEGDGVWDLKKFLLKSAKPGDWEFDGRLVTDQSPLELATQCVWEKCMDHLPNEVPYQVKVQVTAWTIDEDGMLRTAFDIICTRKRQMVHAVGKDGTTVKKIASEAKQALMNTFRRELSLKLIVKMKNQ